jgi:hypothetical protein
MKTRFIVAWSLYRCLLLSDALTVIRDGYLTSTRLLHFPFHNICRPRYNHSLLHSALPPDDNDDGTFVISHVKWKKKRYLLMNDFRSALASGHAHVAVRQARDMMERWWKLYEYSNRDPALAPTTETYNLWMHESDARRGGVTGTDAHSHYTRSFSLPLKIEITTILQCNWRQRSLTKPKKPTTAP